MFEDILDNINNRTKETITVSDLHKYWCYQCNIVVTVLDCNPIHKCIFCENSEIELLPMTFDKITKDNDYYGTTISC